MVALQASASSTLQRCDSSRLSNMKNCYVSSIQAFVLCISSVRFNHAATFLITKPFVQLIEFVDIQTFTLADYKTHFVFFAAEMGIILNALPFTPDLRLVIL